MAIGREEVSLGVRNNDPQDCYAIVIKIPLQTNFFANLSSD